jgi:O-antigen ligase
VSTSPAHASLLWRRRRTQAARARFPRRDYRVALRLGCLLVVLVVQGFAITQSPLWAAPLVCLLLVAVAIDLPLAPFLGLALLVRVLTDDSSSATSRHSAAVNISVLIAGLFILVAAGLILRRGQKFGPALLASFGLCLWTAIAVKTNGASAVTIREGVREASMVAIAVIVCNSRRVLTLAVVTRLIQLAGIVSACIALYQLATHTGQPVAGEIRSNGTFAQPNGAAVFFAVATMASLWRFIEFGHRRFDTLLVALFAGATLATFSLGGLSCLLVMLIAFGLLRPGSPRIKLGSLAVAAVIVAVFLATPLGAERIASQSSTNFASTGKREASGSSLEWRFDKWRTLLPEWEQNPVFGRGLGTTTLTEGTTEHRTLGTLPHSEYVRYLVETGAIGLAALLGGIFVLLRRLRRIAASDPNGAGALGLAITLGLLVNAVAANTLLYTAAAYAAIAIVAAILSESNPEVASS